MMTRLLALLSMLAVPALAGPNTFELRAPERAASLASPTSNVITFGDQPSAYLAQAEEPAPAPVPFWQELAKAVLGTVLAAVGVVATLALRKLSSWADEKAGESKLAKALAALPHFAEAVWADVYGELKGEIEADAADGKIDAEELADLKADAVVALKKALAAHGLEALKDAFGPMLDFVLGKVVATAAAKAAATAAASPK